MLELVEVSPRDGLQNEPTVLSTETKATLITRAIDAGVRRIEVASFVNPRRVPQMADAEAVVAALPRRDDVTTVGLVLNVRGAERALRTQVGQLGAVCVASDAFGITNQGQDRAASLAVAQEVIAIAHAAGRRAQATIAVAFGCPFSGKVDPAVVVDMARALATFCPDEIALADTIGIARPDEVERLVAQVRAAIAPLPVRVHFHDTRGMGVANVMAAVRSGATVIDASIGGTGGCPFAPGATGNVATEDCLYALDDRLGIDLPAIVATGQWLCAELGRPVSSALGRLETRA